MIQAPESQWIADDKSNIKYLKRKRNSIRKTQNKILFYFFTLFWTYLSGHNKYSSEAANFDDTFIVFFCDKH